MKLYKCIGKVKLALVWTLVLVSFSGLFIFSKECKDGVMEGIILCCGVLIPSLFPFFVLASFVSESNIIEQISPLLTPVSKLLLGMNGVCIVPIIMATIGGYPVGARCVATLHKSNSISDNQAQKLAVLCCGAGPGFLITFVGTSLLCSKESGIILFLSQIISITTICLLSRIIHPNAEKNFTKVARRNCSIAEALVNSVNSAVKSTAGMCGFVVLFSVVCKVISALFGTHNIIGNIIVALLEITNGVTEFSGEINIELISALTSFGGLCVHLQIFRELKGIRISKTMFYLFRFIQAAICLFSTKILLLAFPVTDAVFSTTNQAPQLSIYSTVAGSFALIITSILFIISVRNKRLS